jgi:antigen flippase
MSSSVTSQTGPLNSNPKEHATTSTLSETRKESYTQILQSSAVIGGSSAINILLGVLRTKAIAWILGPSGFGLMGLYGSVADFTQNVACLGINSSGVRQIAEATSSANKDRIALTVAVLRRISIILGAIGALLLIIVSPYVSKLTFGNPDHTRAVALLAVAVFFGSVAAGRSALIQGMRRVTDLARMQVFGGVLGTFSTIVLVIFLGEQGIVPSLIAVSALMLLMAWRYSHKIEIVTLRIRPKELFKEASPLIRLGLAFMTSSLVMIGIGYVVRIILVRRLGIEGAGLYQSAWTLGGLYIGFILQAMGADFYPRLTSVAHNNIECNRLVNEQARIGLLLAAPGILATLTFSPLVIYLFYSAKFAPAALVLRWICLGMALRLLSWPMGFVIMAKGVQSLVFLSEIAWGIVHLILAFFLINLYGIGGAGIAFFGSYVFHLAITYPIVRHLSGFDWTKENKCMGLGLFFSICAVFIGFSLLPFAVATCIGTIAVLLSALFSVRTLLRITSSSEYIPPALMKLFLWSRLSSSSSQST